MSHLLTKIRGNRIFYRSIWVPQLYIYSDSVTYKRRKWFVVKEMTISYTQIAQVNLSLGIIFAELEIITTSNDTHTILVKYTPKKETKRAKKIIDQKVHALHEKEEKESKEVKDFEKSLARLKMLLEKQRITKKEFDKKRKELLSRY